MPHAVTVTFDPRAESDIRALWASIANNRINSSMMHLGVAPHLSLGVFDDAMEGPLIARVTAFGAKVAPFAIAFDRIDMFPGRETVLFLAPQASPRLRRLHEGFHDQVQGVGTCAADYRPGAWVPHATIAMGLRQRQLARARKLLDGAFDTIVARIVGLEVVRFRPVTRFDSVSIVHRVALGGAVAAR